MSLKVEDNKINVLIIGVSSPIGRYLATELQRLNENRKNGLGITGTSRNREVSIPGVERILRLDLLDAQSISRFLDSVSSQRFDLTICCAAAVPARTTVSIEFGETNVVGYVSLLTGLLANTISNRAVFLSSAAVYGPDESVLSEVTTNISVQNEYGISKYISERVLEAVFLRLGGQLTALRVPVLLVPNIQNNFIAGWLRRAMASEDITFSNGAKDFNSIADGRLIAQICNSILHGEKTWSGVFNLGAKDKVKVRELAKKFVSLFDSTISANEVPASKSAQLIDISRAEAFGFPLFSVFDSLEWFVNESQRKSR